MALRLLDVITDGDLPRDLPEPLRSDTVERPDGQTLHQILVRSESVEGVLDALSEHDGITVRVSTVDAVLPPVEDDLDDGGIDGDEETQALGWFSEVSLSEMAERARDDAARNPLDLTLVGASSVIASIGMLTGNEAVVVGAMVIAPLIGPLLASAFGAALFRPPLVWHALQTSAVAVGLAIAPAVVLGLIVDVDLSEELLSLRTSARWWDLGVGLAAGVAGAVSFGQNARISLVGVMVAVALVPPAAALGLCLGSGQWAEAGGALGLTALNVGSILVFGAVTFVLVGVRPSSRDEEPSDETGTASD
ncbi:MAG: DUF389 domain-containing protein [Bacteroidota bacterium]